MLVKVIYSTSGGADGEDEADGEGEYDNWGSDGEGEGEEDGDAGGGAKLRSTKIAHAALVRFSKYAISS
jgi:hypothetical protein